MKENTLVPIAVNYDDMVLLCEDGLVLPITTLIGRGGENVNDHREAFTFVAGTDEFGFVVCHTNEFTSKMDS